MAKKFFTKDLKPGMVVTSQRTIKKVYSFNTSWDRVKRFPMKGKAIVLQELTPIKLTVTRSRLNPETKLLEEYESFVTKNMLLLSHYKHGVVMYFAYRKNHDYVWYVLDEKGIESNDEVLAGHPG